MWNQLEVQHPGSSNKVGKTKCIFTLKKFNLQYMLSYWVQEYQYKDNNEDLSIFYGGGLCSYNLLFLLKGNMDEYCLMPRSSFN